MICEYGYWYFEDSTWFAIGFVDDYGNIVVVRSGVIEIPSSNWVVTWDM